MFSGRVERGEGMATRLGCPTANIAIKEGLLIPGFGVYVGETDLQGVRYPTLICISGGHTGSNLKMEVHLLGFNQDLTGKYLQVLIHEKLRDIIPFPGEEEMARIIQNDLFQAQEWFKHTSVSES
ncbi:MAG: Riboflavin biosynthesis protein RibF [Candidatus Uhrbacteria bacterium GW2011_GWF2_39_13]|uniref:riboflavin kinase n=1 Tax=Candidatus Uhrbacteria bacterium GW2011_GWF2_39_13 TaxID=1618995 RepID=A0A0G0MMX8_9BACT|nr:MAG: Riboflavin biosynthesis protein RibF [Candidatus Uhrbacteria bacterium GW2011_GWF2_39_13]